MADQTEPRWFKSSYSGAPNNECVECARASRYILARDSKVPGGPQVAFFSTTWATFIETLRANGLS
ncbi:DUF397 domain-containing protein [Streptomyces sp. NBRC 109706]|uniref:DUF397 domain-containing protein n=1 Tax=Streptomyces sp. NBRC 109706 TaxID=1550035 RepID=UPI00099D0637|nr:DUF397 domain-containing protein [Streptomyces sp. NBRC 109706]